MWETDEGDQNQHKDAGKALTKLPEVRKDKEHRAVRPPWQQAGKGTDFLHQPWRLYQGETHFIGTQLILFYIR